MIVRDTGLEFHQGLLLGCGTGGVLTGKVHLGVICIEVIPSVVGTDDIAEGEGVDSEKDRA